MATFRVFAGEVDRALGFYRDVLGFEVVELHGPAIAILRKGDLTLWVSGPVSSAARPMPDGAKPEPGGWNRMVVEVADLEKEVARLRELGVKFRNEMVSGPGGKQILAEDGEGNVIELFEAR